MKPIVAAAMCAWVLGAGCLGEENYAIDDTGARNAAEAKDSTGDAGPQPPAPNEGLTCGADVFGCDPTVGCLVGESCVGGACLAPPTVAAQAFDPLAPPTSAGGEPELECATVPAPAADAPPAATPVTLFGAVDRLGPGRSTAGLLVEAWRAEDFPRVVCRCDPYRADYSAFRDCVDDQIAGLGEKWTTLAAPAASASPALSFVAENPADCVLPVAGSQTGGLDAAPNLDFTGADDRKCRLGHVCEVDGAGVGHCVEQFGVYSLENVPVNVELVVRVSPAAADSGLWKDVYELGLVAQDLPEKRYRHSVVAMSAGQWTTLLNPWGGVMLEGVGVVAGRVVDCRSAGERGEGWLIQHATIGLVRPPERVVYLGDDSTRWAPETSWPATGVGGRFMAVGVPPGPNRLIGTVLRGQESIALDALDLYVVPDALVVASWPGRAPLSAR